MAETDLPSCSMIGVRMGNGVIGPELMLLYEIGLQVSLQACTSAWLASKRR
jgi:hypothetical protein